MEEYVAIQEGRMQDALSSPKDIVEIVNRRGLDIIDPRNHHRTVKNVSKGIWNRDVMEDFVSAKMVEQCIFMCLKYYRTDQWKQKDYDGHDYRALMQTPYVDRFAYDGMTSIYTTLKQWNMNSRGARLKDESIFRANLLAARTLIDRLGSYRFVDWSVEVKTKEISKIVQQIFATLELTENSKFVTLSKTLHFLHPQLMIPMDRSYTANYFHDFRLPDVPTDKNKQAEWNIAFHKELCKVYLLHKAMIDDISLETRYPVTKLMDNLLIGFFMYRDIYIRKFTPLFISK